MRLIGTDRYGTGFGRQLNVGLRLKTTAAFVHYEIREKSAGGI